MTSVRNTRSGPESYHTAVSVGCGRGRRQAPARSAASAANVSTQRLIFWLHNRVAEQGASLRILPLKIDDRICGSSAGFAVFLDVRDANDLQQGILRERCQCHYFGSAGAANAPRSFEHPRSWPTVSADSLTDVVVPARSRKTVELLRRRIVSSCRTHGGAYLGQHRQCFQTLPASAHAYEIRSAVNHPPLVVPHGPLRSVIADRKAADRNLPHTERSDLAQVLFEHQSIRGHLVGRDFFQRGIKFIQRRNYRLIFSRRTERFLETDRSTREHACGRHLGIAVAKHGIARQHDLPHSLGESRGPAQWSLSATVDEAMSNRFRLHEKMRDHATVQIVRAMNPKV